MSKHKNLASFVFIFIFINVVITVNEKFVVIFMFIKVDIKLNYKFVFIFIFINVNITRNEKCPPPGGKLLCYFCFCYAIFVLLFLCSYSYYTE